MPEMQLDVQDLITALQAMQRGGRSQPGFRDFSSMTPNSPTIYGQGLFALCGDNDIVSALVRDESLLNWLQWLPNNEASRVVKILSWYGPEGAHDHSTTIGYLSDKCARPNSVEWGKCEIYFQKGLLGRCGQEIAAVDIGYKYCNAEPIYRMNGTVINNEAEWQLSLASTVLKDDISRMLITGNASTSGQFDGLEQIIAEGYSDYRTGYVCTHVDPIVQDWAYAGVSGISTLLFEIIERFRLRARALGGLNASDLVIMLPAFLRNCIVNEFACEGPCGSMLTANGAVNINATARGDRDRYLIGGQYGDGWIPINGTPVSFLVNDWIPFTSCVGGAGYASDIYILTRRAGARTVLRGEYQNFGPSAAELARNFGANQFRVTDGGKFLVYSNNDETCFNTCLLTRPGLYCSAPWLQARITNVCCSTELTPLSPDITSEYFLNYEDLYQTSVPVILVAALPS